MAWRRISHRIERGKNTIFSILPCKLFYKSFVEKNYQDLKTLNPKVPILIREVRNIELWARYGDDRATDLKGACDCWDCSYILTQTAVTVVGIVGTALIS